MSQKNGGNGSGEPQPTPRARLKELRLHGYKSFALPVVLPLDAGITAIVGPNGSGKSNIADAIRWVLGEQSYPLLRGKRTEDMIFAGTEQRARLGMAEVQLTFDNSTAWLSVPFQEVTIARRAYRSGENEYLQNGVRVRLRDVMELLASAGLGRHTYTLIGQGMVDQALALSPEERSGLIEEAAGIGPYQDKRTQALAKLAETDANRERILDLLAEMEPRVRTLAHQARRTEEAQRIQDELHDRLRILYRYRWRQANDALAEARAREEAARRQHQQAETLLSNAAARQQALAEQRQALASALATARAHVQQLQTECSAVQNEAAVRAERLEHLRQRLADFRANLAGQSRQLAAVRQEREKVAQQLQHMARQMEEAKQKLTQVEAQRHRQKLLRQQAMAEADAARQRALTARNVLLDAQRRLKQVAIQHDEALHKRTAAADALAAAQAQADEHKAALHRLEQDLSHLEAQRLAQEAAHHAALHAAQEAEEQLQMAREASGELAYEARRLHERYQWLHRLHEEGAGYGNGVKAVLAAADQRNDSARRDSPRLTGIIGTVGSLLRVSTQVETAVEVALAGRVQNVVVETWQDAEAAIAFLKRIKGGRATFLPLDTLRVPSPLPVPTVPGVLGRASDMVEIEPRLKIVADALLSRTVIVRDLPTAHRIFKQVADAGGMIVTLEGDQVRPGGSVSGGSQSDGHDSGLLGREREWRELPERIKALESRVQTAQNAVSAAESEVRRWRSQVEANAAALKRLDGRRAELQRRHHEAQRAYDRAAQSVEWSQRLLMQAEELLARAMAEREALAPEVTRLGEIAQQAQAEAEEAVANAREADNESWLRELAEAQGAHAALQSAIESKTASLNTWRQQEERLAGEIAVVQRRIQELAAQEVVEQDWLAAAQERQTHLAATLHSQQTAFVPQEAALTALETEIQQHAQTLEYLKQQLHDAQALVSQSQWLRQQAEDKLAHLQHEMERDFGLTSAEDGGQPLAQPSLPLPEWAASLPLIETLPPDLEDEIHQLQSRLRRLGPVHPDAPREYADIVQRYEFLQQQAADLQSAADNLRHLVSELDALIEKTFRLTFRQVAGRFRENFTHLFGGGSADLELLEDESGQGRGIDVVARLPGKRAQPLALLSGGERSLTAVALLFSILQVNPTPFCVLDEVDAMLDEANVGRFRELLQRLAERTQFIVISHNRITIEAADTVYGVSMGSDGASRLVSLRPAALARA